jgi:hypothetical protein
VRRRLAGEGVSSTTGLVLGPYSKTVCSRSACLRNILQSWRAVPFAGKCGVTSRVRDRQSLRERLGYECDF